MSGNKPTLWHIDISHFSEKARWALSYKSVDHDRKAPVPGPHMAVAAWLTRGKHVTFPVLELDGKRIGDSTAIIAALEERFPEPPLYTSDPEQRRRALELEDWFDEELGPYIRRLGFYELGRDPSRMTQVVVRTGPPAMARLGRAAGMSARLFTAARFGAASSKAAEEARGKVLAALDRLEEELGSRQYLVGDRFTVADLTAAALFYPLARPPEGPFPGERLPEPFERFRESQADRPGYRWVEEMFRRHRRPKRIPVEAAAI
jgi:glutathione S-transferase